LTQRTRRNLSDPRIKKIIKAQTSQHGNRKINPKRERNAGVSILKAFLFIGLIGGGIALIVYPNWDHLAETWSNFASETPVEQPQTGLSQPPPSQAEPQLAATPPVQERLSATPAKSDTIKPEPLQPVTRRIQVEVLNGCGVRGLADKLTNYLRKNDIDVVSTGNYSNFDILTTKILDRSDHHQRSREIAKLLKLPVERILLRKDESLQLDATIVIGADYKSLKPFTK